MAYWVSLCFRVSDYQLLVKYHTSHLFFLFALVITVIGFSNGTGSLLNLFLEFLKKFRTESKLAMVPVMHQQQP